MLTVPPLPEIGHSETYYANLAHRAQKNYDAHARDGYKVGHYVTLAHNRKLSWPEKLKLFRHALDHHCITPSYARDDVKAFYENLIHLVREHCGEQALAIISGEDDTYAKRIAMAENRELILDEAERFFHKFIEHEECPDWFLPEDYETMKLMRNQWV